MISDIQGIPSPPLAFEERAELIAYGPTEEDRAKIRLQFARRRDNEFPSWKRDFLEACALYVKMHGKENGYV